MKNDIESTNQNVVMQIRQSQEDMWHMKDQLTQSMSRAEMPDIGAGEGNKLSVPFEIDGEEFTLELNNIRGVEVVDLDARDGDDEGAADFNILDQINQIDRERATADKLSQ